MTEARDSLDEPLRLTWRQLAVCAAALLCFLRPLSERMAAASRKLRRLEDGYSREMGPALGFVNQLLVFTTCDMLLALCDENASVGLTAVNALLLYTILTYLTKKIRDIVKNLSRRSKRSPAAKSVVVCLVKILLEWGKAVVLILCLKEQGMRTLPNKYYCAATFLYYVATERLYQQLITAAIPADALSTEGMETYYVSVLLNALAVVISTVASVSVCFHNHVYAAVCVYHSAVLSYKYRLHPAWKDLEREMLLIRAFRSASKDELLLYDDVCAVCLGIMKSARITACGHLFHGKCLRDWCKISDLCPICKRQCGQIRTNVL